jgi:hypothetical protein
MPSRALWWAETCKQLRSTGFVLRKLPASSISDLESRSKEEVRRCHRDRALELDFEVRSGIARGIELDQSTG